jgi:hypothetical protein
MKIQIHHGKLTDTEIHLINNDTRLYPDLTYVSPKLWKTFSKHFILYVNNEFAGVCAIIKLAHWIKIGPFVIRSHFRNKGFGTKLLQDISMAYPNENLYIGSSNPALWKIAIKNRFTQVQLLALPTEVRYYLLTTLLRFINPTFLYEALRKTIVYGKHRYGYFIRKT